MSWIHIHKNKHYGSPLTIKLVRGPQLTQKIIFDESCRYNLGYSQVNKLFGYSYDLLNKDSVRIGWKYLPNRQSIQLFIYLHKNWKRYIPDENLVLGEVQIGQEVKLQVKTDNKTLITYFFINDKKKGILKYKKKYWSWFLGTYFGGKLPAPHDMKIWREDVNTNKVQ